MLALVGVLCLVWSSTWWGIRVCLEVQPPLSSAAVRFLIAGLAMSVITPRLRRLEDAPSPPTWLWIVAGLTNFSAGYGILYCAETVVPSGIAAVLWAVFPLLMAASAVCFLGERLRALQWLGFVGGFAGCCSCSPPTCRGSATEGANGPAVCAGAMLLLSPLVSATGTAMVKLHASRAPARSAQPQRHAARRRTAPLGGGVVGGGGWCTWAVDGRAWFSVLYLAVCGTVLTFGIYFWLLRSAPASLLALINYVVPVLAMVFAEAVGDGDHGWIAWLGAGGVVLGIALVVAKPSATARRRSPAC